VQCRLGLAYLRAAQVAEAIEHLSAACQHKSDYLAARVALASALEEAGRLEEALAELKSAERAHTGQAEVSFCIGYVLEKLARTAEAADAYRRAIEVAPGMKAARQRLAAVALFTDDLAEAIEQYAELLRDDPGDTRCRITLAQLCYRSGDYAKAVEHYENAIAMEPENWSLADEQVEALVADGQVDQAIDRLAELIAVQGEFPDLHVRIADLYSGVGDDDRATWHYRKALDIQPDYLEGRIKFGTHHLINGRWSEASEIFGDAVELNDQLLSAYVGLGVAQAAQQNTATAAGTFDLAAAVEPNSTLLVREMARLQLKSVLGPGPTDRQARPAEQPLQQAAGPPTGDLLKLQLDRHAEQVAAEGDHADLRYRYGVLLKADGRLTEALDQFDKAIELNPCYTQAIIKKGITLQELRRDAEAIAAFKRALELEPEYVDLHYWLGLLYTDGRQFHEAVKHVEEAQENAAAGQAIRARLAMNLQNMGLMDRAAATWRSLQKTYKVGVHAAAPQQ